MVSWQAAVAKGARITTADLYSFVSKRCGGTVRSIQRAACETSPCARYVHFIDGTLSTCIPTSSALTVATAIQLMDKKCPVRDRATHTAMVSNCQ